VSKHGVGTHVITQDHEIQVCLPSPSKVILMLFWDLNMSILEHYEDCEQTINSVWYWPMLEEELKPAICSKHRRILRNGVVLHHNDA